ncbi:hypothetical protein C5167_044110 [Papaver somniferum]|uniref:Uncharacterized protein n=1 Tax=Papaver somniferum TaxID=3469 RepID=A0A4Y7LB66_PAPSO|nr:hypothetical protein C5167_044110 [Papaver somniferum]
MEVFDIDILGGGILIVDFDTWRLQRKLAHAGLILGEFKTLVAETSLKMVETQLISLLAHVAEEGFRRSALIYKMFLSRFAFHMNISLIFWRCECDNYLSIGLPSNELSEDAAAAQDAVLFRGLVLHRS